MKKRRNHPPSNAYRTLSWEESIAYICEVLFSIDIVVCKAFTSDISKAMVTFHIQIIILFHCFSHKIYEISHIKYITSIHTQYSMGWIQHNAISITCLSFSIQKFESYRKRYHFLNSKILVIGSIIDSLASDSEVFRIPTNKISQHLF